MAKDDLLEIISRWSEKHNVPFIEEEDTYTYRAPFRFIKAKLDLGNEEYATVSFHMVDYDSSIHGLEFDVSFEEPVNGELEKAKLVVDLPLYVRNKLHSKSISITNYTNNPALQEALRLANFVPDFHYGYGGKHYRLR